MNFITFKQFIYTINIRDCYLSEKGIELEDNQVIRIYYKTNFNTKDHFIEIGWYDYFNKDTVWKILLETLNKNILNSVVTDFRYNEDYKVFEVYVSLEKDLKCTLQEYQN